MQAQVVVGTEESSAVDAFFGQDLVTEALAELATKEEAAAAQHVIAVAMPASEAFQVSAAQQAGTASDDDYPPRHESPGHGSTSSETSGSHLSQTPESIFRPISAKPQMTLREKFATHVMYDFTPRPPGDLSKSQWVSYKRLVSLFQPYAPTEVWQHGPGNLKQLITDWYKEHPAFAGLEATKWCKLLKDKDAKPGSSSMVSKFSFEYTPNRKRSFGA